MKIMLVVLLVIIVAGLVAWKWVNNLDFMIENHPDYDGDDFLNWDGKHSGWDKRTADWEVADWETDPHTENSI